MRGSTWRKLANACYFLVLSVHIVGGLFLTGFSAYLFGITSEMLRALDWVQLLRPPIVVSVLAIWLPLPIGMIWARRLIRTERYRWSVLVSLLTPFVALGLLFLGAVLVLLPLGR